MATRSRGCSQMVMQMLMCDWLSCRNSHKYLSSVTATESVRWMVKTWRRHAAHAGFRWSRAIVHHALHSVTWQQSARCRLPAATLIGQPAWRQRWRIQHRDHRVNSPTACYLLRLLKPAFQLPVRRSVRNEPNSGFYPPNLEPKSGANSPSLLDSNFPSSHFRTCHSFGAPFPFWGGVLLRV